VKLSIFTGRIKRTDQWRCRI